MTAVAPIRWRIVIGVTQTNKEPRQIVILAAPDSVILDIAGPLEVFAMPDEYYRERYHRCAAMPNSMRMRSVITMNIQVSPLLCRWTS